MCNSVRPDRQTLLFSATFQKRVEKLARDILTEPVRISIGATGSSNTDVTQHTIILEDDSLKWQWLISRLKGFVDTGSVLIFIGRRAGVDGWYQSFHQDPFFSLLINLLELSLNLNNHGFQCSSIHGEMMQHEREKVIKDLKLGIVKILVCTDVAARGLDIKLIKTVVNFDVAKDIDSHVHRVGRTGRAGEKGTAYTLITQKEDRFAADLVRNFEDSALEVPQDLMTLALKNSRFKASRQGFSSRGNSGRGGGGGRGRGRGRGRGGIGVSSGGGGGTGSNPNMIPVGNAPSSSSTNAFAYSYPKSSSSSSSHIRSFQKASSASSNVFSYGK